MSEKSKQYYHIITELLEKIERLEEDHIDEAAKSLALRISEGKLIHVIGPGGHSNMAVEEVFWRAGGLVPINAILDAGTNLIHGAKRSNIIERTPGYAKAVLDSYHIMEGDVLIIVNAYGINAMTIDCAMECKRRGVQSIGITSTSFADFVSGDSPSRHPQGGNLYEMVDVFINTHLPLGDAVIDIDGVPQKMGSTSTFVNTFAMNLLMIRTAQRLVMMGIQPPVWVSANLPEGDRLNKINEDLYRHRIKHL